MGASWRRARRCRRRCDGSAGRRSRGEPINSARAELIIGSCFLSSFSDDFS
jgi:hypothetical protein